VKAARFDYERAESLAHALDFLTLNSLDTKLIAGSQSLGPMLNLRLARPRTVIDISSLSALRDITQEGSMLRIGSGITHAEIEDGVFDLLKGHPWQSVASAIAYRSVRNRGTLGGSIAHADPAADWILAATAMNAEIEISSAQGTRRVPMNQFMLAAYTTVLSEDEIINAIHIPLITKETQWGYFKFCRKIGEFADASCAAYFDSSSKVANLVVGALDGAPKSLIRLANLVASDGWGSISRETVAEHVSKDLSALDMLDQKLFVTVICRCLDRAFNVEVRA
jgi:aerobic carbon-monoxide dehydrogenase medium subunit